MAEAMEVDSVLTEHTNSDNIISTTSDASVFQENTDKPASVLQEKSTDEPLSSSVLQKTTTDEPTSALQEKTTDKPQIPMEKHDTNMKENVLNREPSTNISIDQPITKSAAQELPKFTDPATECQKGKQNLNIPNKNKDIAMEESPESSKQQKLDMSLNSDFESIANNVDLTIKDSITQSTPLDQSNKADKTATEEHKVCESPIEQVKSSKNESEGQNNSSNLTGDDSSQQETLIAQSNSGIEPENVYEGEPKENEPLKNPQDESFQNNSKLTNTDQDKTHMSIEDAVVNEYPTENNNLDVAPVDINRNNKEDVFTIEQNNLKDVPDKMNQNIEEELPLKECNTNESDNTQTVPTNEPKADQSNNFANQTEPKSTKTQNNSRTKTVSNKIQCSYCLKFHPDDVCWKEWKAKGPQKRKRDSDQLPESPAAKIQNVWPTYPVDMVSLIAKHTYNLNNPNMTMRIKMKLIRECHILNFKPIPASWSNKQMIDFIKNHVRWFSETNERCCTFTFVRDLTFNRTGECLVRFKSPEYCHKAWCDLRGVKQIENTPISVDLDLGHIRMIKAKRYNRLNAKYVKTLPPKERNSLGKRNAVEKQKQKIATEESKVGESPIEQVKSSKNESVNPQIEGQNNSSDLTADDYLQQSNSGVEPENVYEGEPKENEPSKNPQDESSQNDSKLSVCTKTDQDKTHISIEDSVINETPTGNNNIEVAPEEINQNNEEDVSMKECNANESVNTQTVSTSEPKADQSSNAANKTELKATTTQNNLPTKNVSIRRQCSTCFKFHPGPCWKAEDPQKRDSDQLPESPAAKKQKVWPTYPADMVSLIGRNIYYPNMSRWTKMNLISVCQILTFKPIPSSWSHPQVIDLIKNHVRCFNETNEKFCIVFFVLNEEFKHTGECLVKFRSPDDCQKAWCDMRGVKIENTPISVDLDLVQDRMRETRRINKLRKKILKSLPWWENSLGTNNVDENQEQKSQGNENDASNSNVNGSSAGNNSSKENAANSTAAATGPNNSVANSAGTSNETQNYNKNNNFTFNSKPSFLPPEKFEKTTYGLNEGFLQTLGLNLPLRSGIVVLGLEHNLSDDKIKEIFSLAGTVKRAFRVMKKDGGPTHKGVVEYDHPIEAVQAVSMFNCQQLYGRPLAVKMASQAFPRPLPEGLSAIGPGLGFGGEPMRGVRAHMEVESLKKMLTDLQNMFNSKIAEMEQSIASLKKAEQEPHRQVPTPLPQTQSTDTATQLVNALSSLTQPNLLMGLTTLLSAQGLAQQGLGTDQAAMANQMMWQNAGYAQNVNMQGMQQPTLPGAFPQPGLAQPALTQPGLAQSGLAQPALAQPEIAQPQMIQPMEKSQMYYGQPDMMQPGFMPTVPPSAPGASVPQMNQQPSTSYPNQPQQMASQQQSTSYRNQPQQMASQQQSTSYRNQPQQMASQQPSTSYPNQPQQMASQQQSTSYLNQPQQMASQQQSTSYPNQPQQMASQQPSTSYPNQPQQMASQQQSTSYRNQPQQMASQQQSTSYRNQPQQMASQQPSTSYPNQPQQMASQQQSTCYLNQPQQMASQQQSTSYPNQPQQMASQQPSTYYPNQPQPIATKQQTHAYTPKIPKNKGSSKNQTTNSNWNTAPVAAPVSQKQLEQKAPEPKPAYSSEPSYYERPSRFDMKEKPNLKVIVPEPEKKKDALLAFSNLPPSVSIEALNSKMREVGDVMFGEMTGRGRALVRFKHARDAEHCFKLFNRSKVDGQVITVEYV